MLLRYILVKNKSNITKDIPRYLCFNGQSRRGGGGETTLNQKPIFPHPFLERKKERKPTYDLYKGWNRKIAALDAYTDP